MTLECSTIKKHRFESDLILVYLQLTKSNPIDLILVYLLLNKKDPRDLILVYLLLTKKDSSEMLYRK